MSDDDVQEQDDAPEADATTDAPDADATTDAPDASGSEDSGDDAVADQVDDLASGHMSDSNPSPQPEGTVGDPIGDAEEHIASLDMDEERRKLQELQNKL
ncbi:MAG: hypothetical protein QOE11_3068 [Solirubrobacteraceae bacterium]|jgi:hypothetical protein|nr:hypothetical protein [Solirubrobacteraceae bacterium]